VGNIDTLIASGATTYVWSPGGMTDSVATFTVTTSGYYTVTGTNGAGCSDTQSVFVNVNTVPVIGISLSSLSNTVCSGTSVTLTANGGSVGTTYLWSTGSNASSITVSPTVTTVYSVIATNGVCADTAVHETINVYPTLALSMPNDSACLGKNTTVSVIATGGNPGYTYTWSNGMSGSSIIVSPAVTTTYTCTVTDACGTFAKDSTVVTTYPPSNIGFTPSPETIEGGQFITFINTSVGAVSYLWNLGDGTTSAAVQPYEQYMVAGTYTVTLIAINGGCRDTLTDTVYVTENIFIPNVFTPNGDGVNDVFHVTMSSMQVYHIEIFNRWGQKVFQSDSPNTDWDGKSESGVLESDGTYYYEITATDYAKKNYSYHGYLQLIGGK
jgi:gliding motility-associated-like protein